MKDKRSKTLLAFILFCFNLEQYKVYFLSLTEIPFEISTQTHNSQLTTHDSRLTTINMDISLWKWNTNIMFFKQSIDFKA